MKTKYKTKNKHMEESRGVYTLPVLYNEQSGTNEGVCVRKELGVVDAIDNEDEFKGVFSKDGEVDVFKQLLSQEVYRYYTEHNAFPTGPLVSYKMDGDIIFDYVEVTIGKMYGGYVYVVHYNFASTAS